LATSLLCCCGCLSTGSQVAERHDPFLEPSAIVAQAPRQRVDAASVHPLGHPSVPTPLPQVEQPLTPAAVQTALRPQAVSLMAYEEDGKAATSEVLLSQPAALLEPIAKEETTEEYVQPSVSPRLTPQDPLSIAATQPALAAGIYPIDLANALGLGGADNLQVRLARTRLFQAQAKHLQAKTLWLPSLRLGLGYNKHDGRLQETQGNVIEVERNSLFYGGGFGLGNTPLPGGAGGPPRLFVNLSLADAYFKPLAACQEVAAHGAAERVATNDSLAEIAIGYHSLLEAEGRLANAVAAREMAQAMVTLVENFEQEGFSSQTEVSRAQTALGRWQSAVADAQRQTMTTSARLARVLRLPPQVQLMPAEEIVMPIDLVVADNNLDVLIGQAWQQRPEISRQVAFREAACFRVQEEKWRPWIPNVHAGSTYGGFGGGVSTDFPSASDRSDVDLLAVWEWKNLGLGNVAQQRIRRGELHEQVLRLEALREQIAAEVVAAAADVASYRSQMQIAQTAISAAEQSYHLNSERIRASEGLPIELLQSISALADARNAYTAAVANYNRAQYRLLRSLGTPAGVPATAS